MLYWLPRLRPSSGQADRRGESTTQAESKCLGMARSWHLLLGRQSLQSFPLGPGPGSTTQWRNQVSRCLGRTREGSPSAGSKPPLEVLRPPPRNAQSPRAFYTEQDRARSPRIVPTGGFHCPSKTSPFQIQQDQIGSAGGGKTRTFWVGSISLRLLPYPVSQRNYRRDHTPKQEKGQDGSAASASL